MPEDHPQGLQFSPTIPEKVEARKSGHHPNVFLHFHIVMDRPNYKNAFLGLANSPSYGLICKPSVVYWKEGKVALMKSLFPVLLATEHTQP